MNIYLVKLNMEGTSRVLNGEVGMTFIVDQFTVSAGRPGEYVAHVQDHRYPVGPSGRPQIWSLCPGQYELLAGSCRIVHGDARQVIATGPTPAEAWRLAQTFLGNMGWTSEAARNVRGNPRFQLELAL